MNDYPNIFDYATKEFTQDAMICWFLSCLNSNDVKVKEIGKKFLTEFVFKKPKDCKFNCEDIIKKAKKVNDIKVKTYHQYNKIDVLAYVNIDNIVIPIIFEDKTDTFLHGNQLYDYCRKVENWKADVTKSSDEKLKEYGFDFSEITDTIYILFKTGYISKRHEYEFAKQYEKVNNGFTDENQKYPSIKNVKAKFIGKKEMLYFLRQIDKEALPDYIHQYYVFLEQKEKEDNEALNSCDMNTHIGHFKFFNELCSFKSEVINCERKRDIYTYVTLFNQEGIGYCLRCQSNGDKSCIYFQQHSTDMTENKGIELEKMKNICENIVGQMNISNFIEKVRQPAKVYKGARIFQITFDKNEKTPQKVGEFIRNFIYKLSVELNRQDIIDNLEAPD